ncbi:MAG: HK97-fold major capsid protein [Clostridia bacterium]
MEKKEIKKVASNQDERLLHPKAFGGTDSTGREKHASKEDMFDSKGELNAYDKKDAITQQEKFASLREQYKKSGSFYSMDEKQRIMEAAFGGNEEERMRFGAEMIPLILDRLDYEGFIRQVFKTHEVAQGQIISYEKDINVTALVIQEDGQTVECVVKGNRVFPAEYWVTAFPKINMAEIAKRQFDIVDRTHDKATFQIMLQEDRNGLRELYQSSNLENSRITISSSINKSVLESMQYEVERHRLICDKFLMNRAELGDFKRNINSMDYDPITSRDMLLTGIFGNIWGVNIFISAGVDEAGIQNVSVPEGMVFAVTEGRYLGAMPVRISLTMLPADQFVFGKFQYGYLFGEMIGMAILNPRAVACGIKTGATVPQWMSL